MKKFPEISFLHPRGGFLKWKPQNCSMTTNGPPKNLNFWRFALCGGVWWPKSVLFVSVCDVRVCILCVCVFYFAFMCVFCLFVRLFANKCLLNSCLCALYVVFVLFVWMCCLCVWFVCLYVSLLIFLYVRLFVRLFTQWSLRTWFMCASRLLFVCVCFVCVFVCVLYFCLSEL